MSNHSTTAPNRRALPWQFNVQVKGRASGSASRSKPHVVVKGQSVTDWLADQIPVLIVLCQVTGYRVEAAHCAWIDAFEYAVVQNLSGVLNGPALSATNTVPAVLGEIQVLWANGLGPTTPPVPDGAGAPSAAPAVTTSATSVYVNGVPQAVQFCGLAPTLTGAYQVNFLLDPSTPVLPEGQNIIWLGVEGLQSTQVAISIAVPSPSRAWCAARDRVGFGLRPGAWSGFFPQS